MGLRCRAEAYIQIECISSMEITADRVQSFGRRDSVS